MSGARPTLARGGEPLPGQRPGGLTGKERAALFWRSMLLQSVWNPRGMQNVGFCFAMLPLLPRLKEGDRAAFLRRHLGFFNTNPVLASYALGATAAAEAEGQDEPSVQVIKKGLSAPLGMAGDALLWGAVRPLAGIVAVALLLFGVGWAPLAFMVVYNVPHLILRWRGIAVGAARGPSGAKEMTGAGLRRAVRAVRGAAAFGTGLVLALSIRGDAGPEAWRVLFAGLFLALAYAAARFRMPATLVAVGGVGAGVVLLAAGLNGG